MADDQFQEKQHQPTERKKSQAREKGQLPRSRDLNTAFIMLSGCIMLLFFSQHLAHCLMNNMQTAFSQAFNQSQDISSIGALAKQFLQNTLLALLPFFVVVFIFSLAGPAVLSGLRFSPKAMGFKFERLNLLKGLKRIFSLTSLMELAKSLLKFIVILSVAASVIGAMLDKLHHMGHIPVEVGIISAFDILRYAIIALCASLLLFAMIDVPYQVWENNRKLKMSTQDIKDELKETEGNPELKQNIKRKQQHLSRQRMIIEIPKATLVITNPEHFAVALKYDRHTQQAPLLVAKGADWMAQHIKHIASTHQVPILSAPPLARSLYYNTELFAEIPAGLYQATAKILAYVYQLNAYQSGLAAKPSTPDEDAFAIPTELRRDQHGRHTTAH